jgi:uncharacterized membrane protein YedE/YeeE
MKGFFIAFLVGTTMGLGLVTSNMSNPAKIQNFLDFTGTWDPSLAIVLIVGIAVTSLIFHIAHRMGHPLFAERLQFPHRTDIDLPLIIGPSLFGIGWGLAGLCTGPGLQSIILAPGTAIWFIPAMLVGLWLGRPHHRKAHKAATKRGEAAGLVPGPIPHPMSAHEPKEST